MKRDKIHLIVIFYPWAPSCYRRNGNAKIDSD